MRSKGLAIALAAGLTLSLGNALAPGRGLREMPNSVAKLLDGSAAPIPLPGMRSHSRGKGKGARPHHSSARFVAQDKRDARKARNKARA